MAESFSTFLMFTGEAEEAMTFYVDLFDDAEIVNVERHGEETPEMAGTILRASLSLGDQRVMVSDSPDVHDFTFTPSTSMFVECESREELEHLVSELSADGETMMPLDDYGFSQQFAWVQDRFGVSWQLNLA